jgi:GNAT superfamily N-acetyltransferase
MSTEKNDPNRQVRVVNLRPEHAEELEALQRIVFPMLTEEELFTAEKYRHHLRLFPEGQFVALARVDGRDKVIGAASAFRTHFDFDHTHHTFLEAIAHGWLTNHDPEGEWLYGADMSVHPDFRRRGVGSMLYQARAALVRRLNLRGEVAGGMLPGYAHYRDQMTVEQYVAGVVAGRIKGMTLAMQLKNGFTVRGILRDHITDPVTNNCAALIVRENPHYRPAARPEAARV